MAYATANVCVGELEERLRTSLTSALCQYPTVPTGTFSEGILADMYPQFISVLKFGNKSTFPPKFNKAKSHTQITNDMLMSLI